MVCTPLRTMRMAFTVLLRLVIDMYAFEVNKPVCRHIYIQPPQAGHRCITDTQICINKTDVRDQQHCTWLCLRDPNCGVVNYNNTGVYCLLGHGPCVSLEKEDGFVTTALQAKSPCLKWPASYKDDTYSSITYPMSIDISDSLNIVGAELETTEYPVKGGSKQVKIITHGKDRNYCLPTKTNVSSSPFPQNAPSVGFITTPPPGTHFRLEQSSVVI